MYGGRLVLLCFYKCLYLDFCEICSEIFFFSCVIMYLMFLNIVRRGLFGEIDIIINMLMILGDKILIDDYIYCMIVFIRIKRIVFVFKCYICV